jgi:geranylgeranyl diphosphate synthase type II
LVRDLGVRGAYERLKECIEAAVAAIPACDGAKGLADLVRAQAMRLTPQQLARSAA